MIYMLKVVGMTHPLGGGRQCIQAGIVVAMAQQYYVFILV